MLRNTWYLQSLLKEIVPEQYKYLKIRYNFQGNCLIQNSFSGFMSIFTIEYFLLRYVGTLIFSQNILVNDCRD